MPLIEFTEASPRQIHEVFSLYNKQGKNLNAEEIRNAVYHEVDLMRALAVAAGDSEHLDTAAPFLADVRPEVATITQEPERLPVRRGPVPPHQGPVLAHRRARHRHDRSGRPPRLPSTATQINEMLIRVQAAKDADPLRSPKVICDLFTLVAEGMEAHAGADVWSPKFKNGATGERWQSQLVASLLGVTLASLTLGEATADALEGKYADIRALTAADWLRPRKTQTQNQWVYIAKVALAIVDLLGVDSAAIDAQLSERFGQSCIAGLQAIRHFPLD